jgi:outer membrane protein OmpA-like peptidoglycan-associated protein
MKNKLVGFSLLATVAAVPTAHAQSLGERIEVGAFGQYTKLDEKVRIDNVIGVGGRLGISVYKWFGVEGDIQFGRTEATRDPFETITYRPYRALGTITVPVTSSRRTSLILGAGYANQVFAGRATANEYEDSFSGLLGLKVCGSGKWGLRLDGLMDYDPSPNEQTLDGTSRHLGVRAGVSYALRGACASGAAFDWGLRLDPASATVNAGTERQFALSAAEPAGRVVEMRRVQNLTCSSSDPSVATVDNTGKVSAVKYGTATITCRGIVQKLERTATSTVTVPAPEWTLTLTPRSGSAKVGQTIGFTARAVEGSTDLGAITWSAANTAIASVSNGTVTCNAAGSTSVTASKTAYGSTKTENATVECTPSEARLALDERLFDFDRAVVRRAGIDSLRIVVEALKRMPSLRVSVEGHTDWFGSESYNSKLARSRADAVVREMLRIAGGDANAIRGRIVSSSFGEQCILEPVGEREQEPPPANRARVASSTRAAHGPNRRVEIWQLLDGQNAPTGCRSNSERNARVPFGSLR